MKSGEGQEYIESLPDLWYNRETRLLDMNKLILKRIQKEGYSYNDSWALNNAYESWNISKDQVIEHLQRYFIDRVMSKVSIDKDFSSLSPIERDFMIYGYENSMFPGPLDLLFDPSKNQEIFEDFAKGYDCTKVLTILHDTAVKIINISWNKSQ